MASVLTNPDGFFSELSAKDVNMEIPLLIVLIALSSTVIVSGIVAIISLLVVFIMWLLCTGVFYIISIFFGGKGSFKRCLEFVGYGFIPMIVLLWIRPIIVITLPPTIDFSSVYTILGITILLWSANIWIFAVKHARNLSARNALITVGAPVGLYLIYNISIII
ncbi:MAG: hypothetical protein EF813_12555 [Methanosarcinales archaeon]|nr:MAG: hypothetical protein EF813_12555 [Methanosarcinales archaeon]